MRALFAAFLITSAFPVGASEVIQTSAGALRIAPMVTGLDEPWGLAFLPGGDFLVTERAGRLWLFPGEGGQDENRQDENRQGEKRRGRAITGLPQVHAQGQGGLLDVMVPRDFAESRQIWLTYAAPVGGGATTALGVGTLSADGTRLEGFRQIHAGEPMRGGNHFGARVVEAADGTLYLTTGDRGAGDPAQDPLLAEGKVIAINRDGSPAISLPGARPGVFSLGHRNIQGAAIDGAGDLWIVEHGARGGDELNRPQAGRNYGWPVISYGTNYNGSPIGEGAEKPGMEQPVHYWDPSIAPSGLVVLSGRAIPEWQGDFLTGSLKFDHIERLDPQSGFAAERIAAPETARVRDVREGPDGAIWFLSVGNGAVYRMAP